MCYECCFIENTTKLVLNPNPSKCARYSLHRSCIISFLEYHQDSKISRMIIRANLLTLYESSCGGGGGGGGGGGNNNNNNNNNNKRIFKLDKHFN